MNRTTPEILDGILDNISGPELVQVAIDCGLTCHVDGFFQVAMMAMEREEEKIRQLILTRWQETGRASVTQHQTGADK